MHTPSILAIALMIHTAPLQAADAVIEPPMAAIPAGGFSMGDASATPSPDYPVALPVRQVKIASFQLSKYEVTVKQYRQFVQNTGHKGQSTCWVPSNHAWGMENKAVTWDRPAHAQNDYHPVSCVSWDDARAYATWLSQQTGKPYRLPSEAEWEYAARAGSAGVYHYGDDGALACRFGNIRDRTGRAELDRIIGKDSKEAVCDDGSAFTTLVGSFAPNAFGLYDMIGNVGEIVEDCEHLTYDGAPADGTAWTAGCRNDMKIHRGGSFSSVVGARSTARGHTGRDNASTFEGFRLALSLPPAQAVAASARRFEQDLAKARLAPAAAR